MRPVGGLTLESRLIRLLGWYDSLGKEVRITIEEVGHRGDAARVRTE